MSKSFLLAATALTLVSAGPAFAQQDDHPCLDELCSIVSIVGRDNSTVTQSTGLVQGTEAPRFGTWGFDMAGRDTSVAPGDDFNRFANGLFLDALEIPADRSRYGAFDMLAELSEDLGEAMVGINEPEIQLLMAVVTLAALAAAPRAKTTNAVT